MIPGEQELRCDFLKIVDGDFCEFSNSVGKLNII